MSLSIDQNILIQSIENSNLAHTISLVDGDMELAYVNQTFLDQTGYTRDEVIGRNCRFLQGEGTCPDSINSIREAIAQCSPLDIEILNYKKDGTAFWNRLRMSPVFDEAGKAVAFIGIQSDVTRIREQQRLEQERQRLEALGRLTGNISHEIKNVLQPVKLMSQTLKDWQEMDPETVQKCVGILNENIEIADQVTKDVLSFSRKPDTGVEVLTLSSLQDDVARFVSNLLHSRIEFRYIQEKENFDQQSVNINQNQLYQILINLVHNALYAMNDKGVLTLHFYTKNYDAQKAGELSISMGEYLCIGIEDNGCGMNEKTLRSALDAFFSTKPPGEGTGLGLSISQRILQVWNGGLSIVSEEGIGSTFTLHIQLF